jgi:AAA15 family ATPase/GTPase
MIEKVEVHNFRCFRNLEVPNLKKFNLLVGKNASGKSAFLESLFLSSSSIAPSIAFQLRAIRKMGSVIIAPTDPPSYKGLWEDMFYELNTEKKIWIKATGNPSADTRSLSIEFSTSVIDELPFGKQAAPSGTQATPAMPQIEFKWKRTGYPEVLLHPRITNTGLQMTPLSEPKETLFFPAIWFTPTGADNPDENAKRFAELDKRGDIGKVKAALTKEFPFIKDFFILYQAGIAMVFADVEGEGRARKLPVGLISDGINRLLGICLGIGYYKDGMVLIDQIEDGLHHNILPALWESIFTLAEDFNVQLFVSTHSAECLEALLPMVEKHSKDICLLRAARTAKLGCTIDALSGEYLKAALEQEIEVR